MMPDSTDITPYAPSAPVPPRAHACLATRPADGVVCFGGVDWWYHNRGHYDLQMMREFSADMPVLYVNSIGMRVPRVSEGAMFYRRVRRKLASLRRGLVEVSPRFSVYSPVSFPGGGKRSAAMVRWALGMQVRLAAWRCGIRRPLIWVACPPAAMVLDMIPHAALVYQRTDRFEEFEGIDAAFIRRCDRQIKERADLILYCSRELYESERGDLPQAAYVDHGVDSRHFEAVGRAADSDGAQPEDVAVIARPRVGFVGGIDSHTFDPALFVAVARALPQVQFVMVGACSLPAGWCTLPNVHFLGQRPYEQVASYMAACDVLIMPWAQNEWIRACNPVKLKEYLAVGRPVVSTGFPEIDHYRDHVAVVDDAETFTAAITAAIAAPGDPERRRARVSDHTWTAKARVVRGLLRDRLVSSSPLASGGA